MSAAMIAGFGQAVLAVACVVMAGYFIFRAPTMRLFHAGLLVALSVHFGRISIRTFSLANGGDVLNLRIAQPDIILVDTITLMLAFVLVGYEGVTIHRRRMQDRRYP